MTFTDIYERIYNCFQFSYLVDLLCISCVDKTIWKQFKDVLKMFFVHWVVYV